MIINRFAKWTAAAVLAAGTIPALALAKSHVSLPTSNITVTPTSAAMAAPVTKTSSRVTHAKAASARVKIASHKSHTAAKHHKKSAKSTSTRSHKKAATSHHVKKTSLKSSKKSTAAKTIRVK